VAGPASESRWIAVGRIGAPHGVRGWVRLRSYTQPPENILDYSPWRLVGARGEQEVQAERLEPRGKGLVARLAGIDDRDAAAELTGMEIMVRRALFPPPAEGEYYWADLIGARVVTSGGVELGQVVELLETGANDVLVLAGERRRLVPFVTGRVIRDVDLDARRIVVDWHPDD